MWINKELYPFQSRFITIENSQLHYVDDGIGPTILFVHGTPEWSFGFRDLIKQLKSKFRCIAIDLLGFGLSDKPKNADYTCAGHARRLAMFIEQLGLKDLVVVANDFGGSISLSYVLDHPDNVRKIILFNTWMRSLKDDKHYSGSS
jgi:haloalkane dehalogenase